MAGMSGAQSYSSDSGGDSPTGSPGPSSSSRRGSKTYMCKVCGHEFASGQSLGGHMNVHRRDQRSPRHDSPQTGEGHHDYKGVRYRKEQNKWVAEIRPPKSDRTWWLGTYSSAREAAYAYDVAITYFRSETALNFRGHPVYNQIPQIDPDLPNQEFAAQLRKVVKKYGKMAMESGAGPSTSSDQAELSWDDFSASLPPLEQDDYNAFNVDDMMPQVDPSEYQDQAHASSHGYQQPYGWSPYNPRDY